MTSETKRPYSGKFPEDQQTSLEERIAWAIKEGNSCHLTDDQAAEDLDVADPYSDEACNTLAKEILYNVIRELKPNLLVEHYSCPSCPWEGFDSEMPHTNEKGNIPDVFEREGEDAIGECPTCGALIFPPEET